MTFIVVPNDRDLETRTFELSYRRLKGYLVAGGIALFLVLMMAGSWLWLAGQAARVPALSSEVRELRRDRVRVQELSRTVQRMEADYAKVRTMLGADSTALPRIQESAAAPAEGAAADSAASDSADADSAGPVSSTGSLPRSWPLAARGFVTRGHLASSGLRHPGMDIAVASGSRILSAGAGVVSEVGEDSVYGRYVRIAHRDGYESLYAHASRLLVQARQPVSAGGVIALSGSTGVSTAPHLHFEIRQNGRPVDPASMVHNPNSQ